MIKVGSFFFPDEEHHFTQFGEAVAEYQRPDREAAYKYVRRWRRALDVGANVGIFSCDFAKKFDEVLAFEPIPLTKECLDANVPSNVRTEGCAIADVEGVLEMYRTGGSGGSFICNHPHVITPDAQLKSKRVVEVKVRTIDSFEFDAVDLIKLDIQGAEYPALIGARETIIRHRPVVMIEEKPFNAKSAEFVRKAADLLIAYGMTPKEKPQADRIYVFEY